MKKVNLTLPLAFILLLTFPLLGYSQVEEDIVDGPDGPDPIITVYPVSMLIERPIFPGGFSELRKWCEQNSLYTQSMADSGYYGKIYCEVIIDTLGNVCDTKIITGRNKTANPYLAEETIRLLKQLPVFTPGKYRNKKVTSSYVFVLLFMQDTSAINTSFNPSSPTIRLFPKKMF